MQQCFETQWVVCCCLSLRQISERPLAEQQLSIEVRVYAARIRISTVDHLNRGQLYWYFPFSKYSLYGCKGACVHVACVPACMFACVHVCMCARMLGCMCTSVHVACLFVVCVHGRLCAFVHVACVHVCMCAWVHVCMCACVHVCMCAWVHGCMGAWVHGCMCEYSLMCALVNVCMREWVHWLYFSSLPFGRLLMGKLFYYQIWHLEPHIELTMFINSEFYAQVFVNQISLKSFQWQCHVLSKCLDM
jgi:hypothetical protein